MQKKGFPSIVSKPGRVSPRGQMMGCGAKSRREPNGVSRKDGQTRPERLFPMCGARVRTPRFQSRGRWSWGDEKGAGAAPRRILNWGGSPGAIRRNPSRLVENMGTRFGAGQQRGRKNEGGPKVCWRRWGWRRIGLGNEG